MAQMRHRATVTSTVLAVGAALAMPAVAPAAITELGAMADGVRGSCPGSCQAVSRTTGYQAKVGPDRSLYRAPADGRIVAWSLALGNPGTKQAAFFNDRLGGAPQAAVVVLDPGKKLVQHVVAKGPVETLSDFFGQAVTFPLIHTLPIRKGQFIGVTVPTWAPALQVSLGTDTSWRSSRGADACLDTGTQSAMVGKNTTASFRCLYRTARLTYSATFVSAPRPAKRPAASG
jgi:hypothetical protein